METFFQGLLLPPTGLERCMATRGCPRDGGGGTLSDLSRGSTNEDVTLLGVGEGGGREVVTTVTCGAVKFDRFY